MVAGRAAGDFRGTRGRAGGGGRGGGCGDSRGGVLWSGGWVGRGSGKWGTEPPVHFFKGARLIAPALAVAAVATLGAFFAQKVTAAPFLVVVLAEMIFSFAIRPKVGAVTGAVSAPAHELRMLGLLLER